MLFIKVTAISFVTLLAADAVGWYFGEPMEQLVEVGR